MTCTCEQCNSYEIERKAKLLELCLKTSHDETVKATNAVWRSRIQKRIDELKVKAEKIKWKSPKIYRHYYVEIKAIEQLLK